ncbi:topoisomerase DNA-binding C4 zinc finger domain-containing protein [Cohnella sp. AR92]|uniref:topoisomerase DNA-binding C4 zinc finger domain-containing protein n=1 Tax=Cohnella sp. AR92 TaxID=648716 RepID=UPI000F8C3ED5|nr:topoisomerase DNA-binding C4 zinc finger domain-containing protein [Cohnella sp. AR92]RUS43321.1 hypothetical protein ELR57_25350 [Cohnella sp. AR92]
MSHSKPLGHDDVSGFEFAREMLDGNPTAAVNIERIQHHPDKGFIIFEYLKCEQRDDVNPHTSHPSKYWDKNKSKFLSLWRIARALNATLYLVNYADAGTRDSDMILVIEVLDMDENGITRESVTQHTRGSFQQFFRALNTECLGEIPCPLCGSPMVKRKGPKKEFYGCKQFPTTGCTGKIFI